MRAVVVSEPGGPDVLRLADIADPVPGPAEVVVTVTAAGVNRADLMQRRGLYPPPPGASDIIGLECSGRISAVGTEVTDWQPGDAVCALLAGGGYAEQVAIPAGQLLPVPAGISVTEAAALPEAACTVYANVFQAARLQPGETLLVHGGASGIGTMAIQLATALGVTVLCTASSHAKLRRCHDLGASVTIDYTSEDFVAAAAEATGGRGVDVILDMVGAAYLGRNLQALATDGRLVVIGLQSGAKAELDLGLVMGKRLTVYGSTLRARPLAEKAAIVAAVRDQVWPLIASGQVKPVIDTVVPFADAPKAHGLLEAGRHVGKVLLAVSPDRVD
jgi:putative PIG3 family NAD(P)H quinone oxidoreductase